MGVRQCPSCSGQMSTNDSTCPWCGRSPWLGTVLQLLVAGCLVLGATIFSGVLPWSSVSRFLHIDQDDDLAVTSQAPRPASRPEHGGSGARSQNDAIPSSRRDGDRQRSEEASAVATSESSRSQRSAADASCASPDRIRQLTQLHREWSQRDAALIACGELRNGFTTSQVEAALGRPPEVVQDSSGRGREEWVYGQTRVTVEGGRVVRVRLR
jgi:hypothetical protein